MNGFICIGIIREFVAITRRQFRSSDYPVANQGQDRRLPFPEFLLGERANGQICHSPIVTERGTINKTPVGYRPWAFVRVTRKTHARLPSRTAPRGSASVPLSPQRECVP